jgi:hypothetical protein
MKKIKLLILLSVLFPILSWAQIEHFSMQKMYTNTLENSADYKPVCVSLNQTSAIASINPNKFAPYFPDQRGGDMRVSLYNSFSNASLWDIDFKGTIFPYQVINHHDSVFLVGVFADSISVAGNAFLAMDSFRVFAFVASIYNGQLNWLKVIEDTVWNSMANAISILPSGNLLVTTLMHDVESAIWKLNPKNGNVISIKHFPGIRSISSIEINNDKIYFAGSTQDFAMIDTFQIINPLANGYVNYMCVADTNLSVKSVHHNPYITFDFSSHLTKHKNGIAWTHYSIIDNMGFIQNLSVYNDTDSLIFKHVFNTDLTHPEFENRLISSKYYDGDLILLKRIDKDYYMFDIKNTIRDSVQISINSDLTVYDLSSQQGDLLFVSQFKTDSLYYLNDLILNPYAAQEKSAIMISYLANNNSGILGKKRIDFKVYPNPVEDFISIQDSRVERVEIINMAGQLISIEENVNTFNTQNIEKGMYILKAFTSDEVYIAKFIKK